jgi:hypothetical protein
VIARVKRNDGVLAEPPEVGRVAGDGGAEGRRPIERHGDVLLLADAIRRRRRVRGTYRAFSGDETTDVGFDSATPVSDDYGPRDSEFTGRVRWVQLDIDEAAENVGA